LLTGGRRVAFVSGAEMMLVLRDAVETRKPVIMEVALDCIQKLVSFKLLQGPVHSINHKREGAARAGADAEAAAAAPLQFAAQPPQAQAVELLCGCDDTGDEAVELRLLKAVLTCATSPTLTVHGQALLLLVRACYNVFLTSRSDVNQTTAKATLTQMVNVVFQRMEAGSLAVVVPPMAVTDMLGLPPGEASNVSAFVQQFLHDVAQAVDPFGSFAEGVQAGLDDAFAPGGGGAVGPEAAAPPPPPAAPRPAEEGGQPDDLHDSSDPVDAQRINWRTPAGADAAAAPPGPDASPSKSGATDAGSDTTSAALFGTASGGAGEDGGGGLAATLQKDAFLVFRALCKLSTRSPDAAPASELATVRGKVLALELLKVLLENAGPAFSAGERFVGAIKQYLCLSLLKNCASAAPKAQALCASIFLTLLTRFRRNLKAEIGVFFPMIFLRPIEPPAGGGGGGGGAPAPPAPAAAGVDPAQRAVVLRCLHALCCDGQLLVDIFVNYDCDLGGANLFERMVGAVVRIAQGTHHPHDAAAAAADALQQAMRYDALRCLSASLRALAAWHAATHDPAPPAAPALAAAASDAAGVAEPAAPEDAAAGAAAAAPAGLGVPDEKLRSAWMERLAAGAADGAAPGVPADGRQGDLFETWKAFKRAFEQGVAAFNRKPKAGVRFMQEQALIGGDAEDVAKFLASTKGLDLALVGDYLGERDDFNLRVMHCYVDALDFGGLDFDEAIRKFLSGFRLPGEAQKIDRLMEKFAARFVSCNPEAFRSADVAYVLAYSVIMLNTDAHNPGVKNKMTKADFLRNNRGINDGGDVAPEFMEALYDRIVHNEIKMKGEGGGGGGAAAAAAAAAASAGWLDTIAALIPGRQRAAAGEDPEEAVRRTHDFLREQAKGATFFEARGGDAVRPMLDVAWAPMLGAFR
jgi:brefeldin A-inhibited guanine nucleotide-exchange protein